MPLDAPAFLTAAGQREKLADGLEGEAVEVASGAELAAFVEGD